MIQPQSFTAKELHEVISCHSEVRGALKGLSGHAQRSPQTFVRIGENIAARHGDIRILCLKRFLDWVGPVVEATDIYLGIDRV